MSKWSKIILWLWVIYITVLLLLTHAFWVHYSVYYKAQTVLMCVLLLCFTLTKWQLPRDFWNVEAFHITALAWYQLYWAFSAWEYDPMYEYMVAMLPYTASCWWLFLYLYDIKWSRYVKMTTGTSILIATWMFSYIFSLFGGIEYPWIFNITNGLILIPVTYKLIQSIQWEDTVHKFISMFILGTAWYQIYFAVFWLMEIMFWYTPVYWASRAAWALIPFNYWLFCLVLYILYNRFRYDNT